MDYTIAIVGPSEAILGFKGLGLKICEANTQEEVETILFDLKKKTTNEESNEKYAIAFVIEDYIKAMEREKYEKLSSGAFPAIIPIPSSKGATGFGDEKIRRIVEKAVGSDIFG